jgi:hypothetical protein
MRGKGPDDLPELFRLDLKEEEFVKETKAKRRVRDTPWRRSSIEEEKNHGGARRRRSVV